MGMIEELERLNQLRVQGALSFLEFEEAKRKVLAASELSEGADGSSSSHELLAEIKHQNALAEIDRDWDRDRKRLMIRNQDGGEHVPTVIGGVVVGAFTVVFGLFWMGTTSSMRSPGGGGGPAGLFPLFGLVFIAAGIAISAYTISKAGEYKQKEQRYKRKRAELSRSKRASRQNKNDD